MNWSLTCSKFGFTTTLSSMMNEFIIAYKYISFIQHRILEIVCNLKVTLWSWFDIRISSKDPQLLQCASCAMCNVEWSYGRSCVTILSRPIQLYARIQSWNLSKGHLTHGTESQAHIHAGTLIWAFIYIYIYILLFSLGLRARDHYASSLSLVEKAEPVQVRYTLRLRDQRSMWMQDGCKVYMASHGPCFMVTWTISKTTS